jgi:hypothetical protein
MEAEAVQPPHWLSEAEGAQLLRWLSAAKPRIFPNKKAAPKSGLPYPLKALSMPIDVPLHTRQILTKH